MIKKQKSLRTIDKTRKINPIKPEHDFIKAAAGIIKKGGIVSFPTTGLYGLGVDAYNADAVKRVFEIKHRPADKPVLVLIKNRTELNKVVRYVPSAALRIMDNFWPGKVTIVFEAQDTLPDNLTAGTGKIGVRLPEHAVAVALLNALDGPITGTSANISGSAPCSRISNLDSRIADQLDLILDAGHLKGGSGSTVVDVTTGSLQILREGKITAKDIFTVLNKYEL